MEGAARNPHPGAETLVQMADTLAWPLLLLTTGGHLLHANLEARLLLARRNALKRMASGQVQAVPAAQQLRFADALLRASQGEPNLLQWPPPVGCTAAIQRLQQVELPPGLAARHDSPAILMVALTLAAAGRADSLGYARAHGLTRAEGRVLQRLVLGDSPEDIARHLEVAVATVRSQTAAIRRKTGHRSMAQLVGAVARGSPVSASSSPNRRPAARPKDPETTA
jgi:DNA-binding CsgD family transcriptional regulator